MKTRIDLPRPEPWLTKDGEHVPPPMRKKESYGDFDQVLYDCPDCNRVHLVALTCPTAEEAVIECREVSDELGLPAGMNVASPGHYEFST